VTFRGPRGVDISLDILHPTSPFCIHFIHTCVQHIYTCAAQPPLSWKTSFALLVSIRASESERVGGGGGGETDLEKVECTCTNHQGHGGGQATGSPFLYGSTQLLRGPPWIYEGGHVSWSLQNERSQSAKCTEGCALANAAITAHMHNSTHVAV